MSSFDVMDGGVTDPVDELLTGGVPGLAEIAGHLGLAVDPDTAPDQVDEVEVVPLAGPLQVDAPVLVALGVQALTEPEPVEQVDGRVLQDAGPDPGLDVLPGPGLDHHRLHAVLGQ
jgi:hypothetical protein